jgi:aryl-phospho-beta-D-glucosidase BglC (GH1 family)
LGVCSPVSACLLIRLTDTPLDWAFQKFNDPYIQGAAPYIDQAITWARSTGLKVWIDLHGAPGSQNGYDNSGHNGTIGWGDSGTVAVTKSVIQQIANKYAQPAYQDTVVAIEVLNEPQSAKVSGGRNTVVQYYNDAYGDVSVVSDTPVVLHDGFQPGTFWNGVLSNSKNVVIDHHEYQVFTPELIDLSADQHVKYVRYIFGPFVSHSKNVSTVVQLSNLHPDLGRAKSEFVFRYAQTLEHIPQTSTIGSWLANGVRP